MNLTDKAREDFLKYISYRFGESENDLRYRYAIYVNALIIEWLDSVGIFIQHWNSDGSKGQEFDSDVCFRGKIHHMNSFSNSRKEAIDAAIIKANEIYNSIKS